jgi:TonB family protein
MVVLSLAIHLTGFGLALGLPRWLPRRAAGPAVYVVDLVSLPAGPAMASPDPAPAAPAPPKPAPPKAEKPIKLPGKAAPKTPPRNKTKQPEPEEKPEPETKKPEPVAAAPEKPASTGGAVAGGATAGGTTPGAAGIPGGTGAGAGGTGGRADEYTFYLSLVERKIKGAWRRPPPNPLLSGKREAKVRLTVTGSGRVTASDLAAPSGYDPLDRSALRAVQDAQPFPPFPYQIGVPSLTVDVVFDWDPVEN